MREDKKASSYNPDSVPDYLGKCGESQDITNIPIRDRERLFLDMQETPLEGSQLEEQAHEGWQEKIFNIHEVIPRDRTITQKQVKELLK